jgi:hypothetical protein
MASVLSSSGDGNSPWARRQRDLIALHIADLGGEEHSHATAFSRKKVSSLQHAGIRPWFGGISRPQIPRSHDQDNSGQGET